MSARTLALAGALLLLPSCARSADGVGAQEQRGTAGQDVEVAHLRQAFGAAARPFDPAQASLNWGDTFSVESHGSSHAQDVWQCERRDAGLDAAPTPQATTYSFGEAGYQELVALDAGHAGARFLHDIHSNELVGYGGAFVTGALGSYAAIRLGNQGDLLIEEFVRPTVEQLSGPDSATYEKLLETHDASVVDQGPAIAYTHCTTRQVFVSGERVALFDDFQDPDYTRRLWGSLFGFVTSGKPGWDLGSGALTASVADSIGAIKLSYREGYGPLTVSRDGFVVTLSLHAISTNNGYVAIDDMPQAADVSIDIQAGKVIVLLGSTKVEIADPAAAPFVYQGRPATLQISSGGQTFVVSNVTLTVP